jgi:predicted short-subunit dehydrogenase-like oxidoreductase (DUF2520 family)
MNFNIIGAGTVGKNIALALSTEDIASLNAIVSSTKGSAAKACQELALGHPVEHLKELPEADVTWICCTDNALSLVVADLAQHTRFKENSLIIHCSGVFNSEVLAPLKAQNCFTASFHPLKAFKKGYLAADAFNQVSCVIEGDEAACAWLTHSFNRLGAQLLRINPAAKAMYHAAASISANYLITLAACSEELLIGAGIPQAVARHMICNLMAGNVNNLRHTPILSKALTGPLMRGDEATVALHLQAIDNPLIKKLYKAAGLATLPLTELTVEKMETLVSLLDDGLIYAQDNTSS